MTSQEQALSEMLAALEAKDSAKFTQVLQAGHKFDSETLGQIFVQAADSLADKQVFEALLASGANVNACDEEDTKDTALHISVVKGAKPEIVDLLLTSGANASAQNAYGETPLHLAISLEDSFEVIHMLVVKGKCDVNLTNELGETAFHFAAKTPAACTLQLAKLLLQHQGNLSAKTEEGEDVIDIARRRRVDSQVFEFLHEAY